MMDRAERMLKLLYRGPDNPEDANNIPILSFLRPRRQDAGTDPYQPGPNSADASAFQKRTAEMRFGEMFKRGDGMAIAKTAGSAHVLIKWHEALVNSAVIDDKDPLQKLQELVEEDERLQSSLARTYGNDLQKMYEDITKFGRELLVVRRRRQEDSEARQARGF